jgi:predicted nucleic acid-binding Zn finger protein
MRRKKSNKVQLTLERKAVRKHMFLPSQTEIWTVIGDEGDNLINDKPLFCSCKDYYFNILKKKRRFCYHLRAFLIAKEKLEYSTFYYHDDEFESFMKILFMDIR